MVNIWYFVGGALFQALIGIVLDNYGKVGGKFPVAAYRTSFIVCFISLIVGAIAMYFTTDTKVVVKNA
jgi:ABC-type uncharacterized transport system permease subunit